MRKGLANTKWPGRFEFLRREPPLIIDGAHNAHGAYSLAEALRKYANNESVFFIMGVLADKDYSAMLDAVCPLASRFFTVAPDSPRALPAEVLAEEIRMRGIPAKSFENVSKALKAALMEEAKNETICCFGSLYFIGESRTLLLEYLEGGSDA